MADPGSEEGVRLQKVLAGAGVGSRRACEVLIAAGRVEVDGQIVRTMGLRVDPTTAVIKVDGMRVTTAEAGLVHLALNKPRGVVSTMSDPEGRPSLQDYVHGRKERLFHVGRLDADTEGLILLTNDGELAHRLAHPSYEILKTYVAEVPGPVAPGVGKQLREGITLDDGPVQVTSFRVVDRVGTRVMVEVALHEGRKHVVRRMLKAAGHPVQRLVRTHVGPVALSDLRPGNTRALTREEVANLYKDVGL
ncbi:pseudouridine synthase [Phytoactinopolyspora mesophila]|uniref:Pseudouridine synthase n=1 Tax=Phytoactinopolyspora mesophila TaxID=2650750 RepID=A0A7K3LZZ7_9ACTN|nr:pseudouridine synthase [Phytoactinopolyspora mesophila]NDL56570.1 pseudouridine synthase [Phytoactinopolyspora mesophila]